MAHSVSSAKQRGCCSLLFTRSQMRASDTDGSRVFPHCMGLNIIILPSASYLRTQLLL